MKNEEFSDIVEQNIERKLKKIERQQQRDDNEKSEYNKLKKECCRNDTELTN